MFNIVVFSGGTGSIALQNGLASVFGIDNYNLDIIINAYDNGKSTGVCRKIFNDKILGPSDFRKNQLTQFKIQKATQLKDFSSRESVLLRLFELRFDAMTKEEYYEKSCQLLERNKEIIGDKDIYYLKSLLDYFFFEDINKTVWRKKIESVEFNDFSIANVFYSAAAAMNGNSLRLAGRDIANVLDIKDNVHLISDINLYLQAMTQSGVLIEDEGDIVTWDNPDDKIASVLLLRDGREYVPSVDEETDLSKVKSCKSIIENADVIIFSSGTQWSSLIPSYMHSGLRNMLNKSKAKKYLVMNNIEDHDMRGVNANDIIDILTQYIPINDITTIVNDDAVEGMNVVTNARNIHDHISGAKLKHNPVKLINLIMKDYFGIDNKDVTYIYDLDGTLWDERTNNKGRAVGVENMNLFSGIIHSGNSYEHVRDVFKYLYHQDNEIQIYSDFGNIHFTSSDFSKSIVSKEYIVDHNIEIDLQEFSYFKGKVITRGEGSVITIKPLANREFYIQIVNEYLQKYNGLYVAKIAGHTSIDITHKDYNKKTMIVDIIKEQNLNYDGVVFVGNETIDGAEVGIADLGIRTIQVNDVYECNMLLRAIRG